jgi:hypothetical protein
MSAATGAFPLAADGNKRVLTRVVSLFILVWLQRRLVAAIKAQSDGRHEA